MTVYRNFLTLTGRGGGELLPPRPFSRDFSENGCDGELKLGIPDAPFAPDATAFHFLVTPDR